MTETEQEKNKWNENTISVHTHTPSLQFGNVLRLKLLLPLMELL